MLSRLDLPVLRALCFSCDGFLTPKGITRFTGHQDYSYWCAGNPYQRAPMPSPDVATCAIAIDHAHSGNGCLQMLRGSHKLGLLDFHALPWGERHAKDSSVRAALECGCAKVHCEQQPGDALFFNCLTLHCSEANRSASQPRWAFLAAFDNMQNALRYVPEAKPAPSWPDRTVLDYGRLQLADGGTLAWDGEDEPSSQEEKVAAGRKRAAAESAARL
eukprot:SAG22_NODE_34_length_27479_cov_10.947480_4_plen_217_part_00